MDDAPSAFHVGSRLDTEDRALLTAIETVRTLPTSRGVFAHTKIVHVMEGAVEVETERGTHRLKAGMAMALGSGQWCRVQPLPRVRLWTVYADEHFLRTQMAWFLPDKGRLQAGSASTRVGWRPDDPGPRYANAAASRTAVAADECSPRRHTLAREECRSYRGTACPLGEHCRPGLPRFRRRIRQPPPAEPSVAPHRLPQRPQT